MKKLLIIGASVLQLPAIKRAKELGYYVGVIDYDPNAVGIPFADEYFNVSTNDPEGVAATAKKFAPDGIMTTATDMPMRSIAYAGEVCNLPAISLDTAIKSTDKGEMIRAFEQHGVEHPWFYLVSDISELNALKDSLTYPLIMKPTDNSASRGVVLCRDFDEVMREFDYSKGSSHNGNVIIEEYLEGKEVSVEVITLDGVSHIIQITDKITTGAPHFVEMGHSQPSALCESEQEKIRDLAARAVKAVGIQNGPAHVEIMLTKNGPKMIELGARLGGDFITTHLVPLSTGVDMVEAVIKIACGEKPDLEPKFSCASAIKYLNTEHGIIQGVSGTDDALAIPEIKEVAIIRNIGEFAGEIKHSLDRVGYVIAQAETPEKALSICDDALKLITVHVK